jgi:hypothetical protein
MAVYLAVFVDRSMLAVDTHRDAAQAVHRDCATQQAPGGRIRCAPTQHLSDSSSHLTFGTVEPAVGAVVPLNRCLIVVIKNEAALRGVATHQQQGHCLARAKRCRICRAGSKLAPSRESTAG